MAKSFAGGFQLVEVTTDELVRGLPKKQLWVAASKREHYARFGGSAGRMGRRPLGYSARTRLI
jgi:hypothetical protein